MRDEGRPATGVKKARTFAPERGEAVWAGVLGGQTWVALLLAIDEQGICSLVVQPLLRVAGQARVANCWWNRKNGRFLWRYNDADTIPWMLLDDLGDTLRAISWSMDSDAEAARAAGDAADAPRASAARHGR